MEHHEQYEQGDPLDMISDELIEAMKQGAVVNVGPEGVDIAADDDLPPDMRECIRISRKSRRIFAGRVAYKPTTPEELAFREEQAQHRGSCPSCLDAEADSTQMDADSWREEGAEVTALELEADAAELRAKAARIKADRAVADPKSDPADVERTIRYRVARDKSEE